MSNHNYNAISAEQYSADWRDTYPELGVILWAIGLPFCLLGPAVVGVFLLSEFTDFPRTLEFIPAGLLVAVGGYLAFRFRNWIGD
jgi:hypothetical protein